MVCVSLISSVFLHMPSLMTCQVFMYKFWFSCKSLQIFISVFEWLIIIILPNCYNFVEKVSNQIYKLCIVATCYYFFRGYTVSHMKMCA